MGKMVFTPCTGAVEVNRKGCTDSDFLTIKINDDIFTSEFILQGVTLELAGNYQFLHTVNDFVYFYSFGDRVGTLTVMGVGFLQTCSSGGDGTFVSVPKSGANIFYAYEYYNKNKSVARRGKTLKIVLTPPSGNPVKLHGFLTGMKTEVNQSDSGPVGYWTFRFEVLPQKEQQ